MNNPQLDGCCGRGYEGDEDGFFYCPVCGCQSPDMISTFLEVDDVYRNTIYGRTVRSPSPPEPSLNSFLNGTSVPLDFGNPKRPDVENPERPVEELCDSIRLPYIQGIRIIIQKQCEALVEKFGGSAMICGIAGTIWLRFVAVSGVFVDDWVKDAIMESEIRYQTRHGNEEEYLNDLNTYLKYCKDIVFAGLVPSYEEDKIAEQLWNFYESDKDIKISVEAQTGGDAFNQNRDGDAEHDIRSSGDKKFASGEQIKTQLYNSNCFHADANPDRDDYATRPVMRGEASSSGQVNSDAALRKLKADMEENSFHYVPPRRARKDGYLYYRRVIFGGVYECVAHADYYILLRACAKVVQVDVRVMHACVLELERRLARVDEWIDKFVQTMTDPSRQHHKPN